MLLDASDGVRLIQICVVIEVSAQFAAAGKYLDGQIEARMFHFGFQRSCFQTCEIEVFQGKILQDKHHLKQWRMFERPFRVHGMNQSVKRDVLMFICAQGHFANATEQLCKRGIAAQVSSQNKIIDEKSDERMQFRTVAVGGRRTDNNILLPAIARQKQVKRRQQGHK